MKTKSTVFYLIAALLPSVLASPAQAVDLFKLYPTRLVKGDAEPEHAREWEFQSKDIFRLSHFSLEVGKDFKIETGTADLGIGHCADGAVWAVVLPRESGTLTSSAAKKEEAIAHVWLRFHPAQIDRLFSPSLVSADGNADLAGAMRAIAKAKMTSSWQANGRAMIPEPKDMTVYSDTKDGVHRFFIVDTQAKTAEYVAAFNESSTGSALSWESAPPVVVKTIPEAGATNVPPGETEIQVTFSKEMADGSWSWSTAWENSTPAGAERPRYDASHRTCVLKVNLEPGKTYGWWLNSQRFHNFKDTQGHAAVPYLLTFQTASEAQLTPSQPGGPAVRINPQTGMPASKSSGLPPGESAMNAGYTTAREVRDLIASGQYDDALQRCLAFHDEFKASGALIPLLSDWVELGRRYPKAKEALIEIRDHDVREFSAGRGYADLFSEVNSINGYLHQDDATYELFRSFRDRDPDLAQQCYFYVEGLLVAKGDSQWCYDHMGDPQGRFDSIHQSFTMQLDNQKRMAAMNEANKQRIAEMNRQHGWTNAPAFSPPDTSAMMKRSAENNFVGQTRQLIEILVATGHKTDAEKIQEQAVVVLDDPRLQSAVSDATKKMGGEKSGNKTNNADDSTSLLNDDQRAMLAWTDRQFHDFFDARSFDGWSEAERATLERKLIDALKGPQSREYYQAINTLAALRSTQALPALRGIAFDRAEKDNRDRWMATRALGLIGDKEAMPQMIHLLYHGNANTRWWAQLSLVRLTGTNFGKDWSAWGKWWNDQNGQPPFQPEIIRWYGEQPAPDKLVESLDQRDNEWLAGIHPLTGEQYVQQQLKLAQAGDYWAKFNLWEALSQGKHEVFTNSAEADKWLAQLVNGAYLARFEPVNGFNPKTPKEMLDEFNGHCQLRSDRDSLGGASFFRTAKQGDKLIGSFLTATPDEFKTAIEKDPSFKLISIEPVTPEMFLVHETSAQESL